MDSIVLAMAALRFLSATIEFSAAMLMLYFGRVETAFKINATLAVVGPTIMLVVTGLGLVGLVGISPAGKPPLSGIFLVLTGVGLIFLGLKKI